MNGGAIPPLPHSSNGKLTWLWHYAKSRNVAGLRPYEVMSLQKQAKQTPCLLGRKRTIPNEGPPLVGEVSDNSCE
jgi:hypothetical protein